MHVMLEKCYEYLIFSQKFLLKINFRKFKTQINFYILYILYNCLIIFYEEIFNANYEPWLPFYLYIFQVYILDRFYRL